MSVNKQTLWIVAAIVVVLVIGVVWQRTSKSPLSPLTVVDSESMATSSDTKIPLATPISVASQTMMVRAYFSNKVSDPKTLVCEKVYPVYRTIPRTVAVARTALTELLSGPTSEEIAQGFLTSLPAAVKIQSLTIENGVAKVDFSAELGKNVAGACRVAAIRSQITETLKQFPTIKSVVISIAGKSDGILQP